MRRTNYVARSQRAGQKISRNSLSSMNIVTTIRVQVAFFQKKITKSPIYSSFTFGI